MTRPLEFLQEDIDKITLEMEEIRGILYGDKRRNEVSGIVQAVGQIARLGEERDRQLKSIKELLESNAAAVARLEVRLEPVAMRAESQRRNATSATFGHIALILWVLTACLPILISDFRSVILPDEPWLWFGLFVLAAALFTGLSAVTKKNGNGH